MKSGMDKVPVEEKERLSVPMEHEAKKVAKKIYKNFISQDMKDEIIGMSILIGGGAGIGLFCEWTRSYTDEAFYMIMISWGLFGFSLLVKGLINPEDH